MRFGPPRGPGPDPGLDIDIPGFVVVTGDGAAPAPAPRPESEGERVLRAMPGMAELGGREGPAAMFMLNGEAESGITGEFAFICVGDDAPGPLLAIWACCCCCCCRIRSWIIICCCWWGLSIMDTFPEPIPPIPPNCPEGDDEEGFIDIPAARWCCCMSMNCRC